MDVIINVGSTATSSTNVLNSATTTRVYNWNSAFTYRTPSSTKPSSSHSSSVSKVHPLFGPAAGGTRMTLTGTDLEDAASVLLVGPVDWLSATVLSDEVSSSSLVALTPPYNEIGRQLQVTVVLPGQPTLNTSFYFSYRPNPVISDVYPRDHLIDGGTVVTVSGQNLNSAAFPTITITVVLTRTNGTTTTMHSVEGCSATDDTGNFMTCIMPSLNLPSDFYFNQSSAASGLRLTRSLSNPVDTIYSSNGVDRADIYIGFQFDGYTAYNDIGTALPNATFQFFPPPTIQSLKEILQFNPNKENTIAVEGQNMRRGCRLIDYMTTVGAANCSNVDVTDNRYIFTPPNVEPPSQANNSFCSAGTLQIKIAVGYHRYHYACMQYTSGSWNKLLLLLLLLLLLIPIIILAAWLYRRHRGEKHIQQRVPSHEHNDYSGTIPSPHGHYLRNIDAGDDEGESKYLRTIESTRNVRAVDDDGDGYARSIKLTSL